MLKILQSSVQYLLRYLLGYADFFRLVPKVTETPHAISGFSGPVVIKVVQNIAKLLPFNTSKSELR